MVATLKRDLGPILKGSVLRGGSPQMRQFISSFCRTVLADYRRAGYPFGTSMDGLLVWLEFGQKTTDN